MLFSEWFLDGHCFQLGRSAATSDTIHVRFAPANAGPLVDISGDLALDAKTFALLKLRFQGENLPRYIDNRGAGGEVRFHRLDAGAWIPASWTIWAPVQGTAVCSWRVVGLVEKRTVVQSVYVADSAANWAPIKLTEPLIPRTTLFDKERCAAPPRPYTPPDTGATTVERLARKLPDTHLALNAGRV